MLRLAVAGLVATLACALPRSAVADESEQPSTQVFVDANEPHLTLLQRTPRGEWVTVCDAPCSTDLEPGLFQGAVSRRGGARLEADYLQIPKHPARLRLEVDRGRNARVIGWVIFGLGLAGGISGASIAFVVHTLDGDNTSGFVAASLVSFGFSGAGLAMALTSRESARIEVVSTTASASAGRAAASFTPGLRVVF
jgi:hypothetical protein